jgi:DNA-binding NarL/FixJ family response regulator
VTTRERASGKSGDPILVVDQDPEFRAFVATLLGAAGFAVTGTGSGEEALELCERLRPRIVVLDVRLEGICGYEVCRKLRERDAPAPLILFASGERAEHFDRVAGLIIGADDYLAKPVAADELLARVRCLLRRTAPAEKQPFSFLTPREREVLTLLAGGSSPREIAARLVISVKTVATHLEHVLAKLGVHSRAEAVAVAYREGLV